MSHLHRIEVTPRHDCVEHDDLQPVQIVCRECGDTEIQFVPIAEVAERIRRQRCDECQAQYEDERRGDARRAVDAAMTQLLTMPSRSRGPNDERSILCDECGEEAGTYIGYVDHLDGKAAYCPHCQTHGKIVVGDDEGSAWVRFRAYTAKELAQ